MKPQDQIRRNLLTALPGFLLAPAAFAAQAAQTGQAPKRPTGPPPKKAPAVKRDIPILPFALAGAFCDDFGGKSSLKITPYLSGEILFSAQEPGYQEDALRMLYIQVGAACECVSTLGVASSCVMQNTYPQNDEQWILKTVVGFAQEGNPISARGIAAANALWTRPNCNSPFDPAWKDAKIIQTIGRLMQEYGVTAKVLSQSEARVLASALQTLAKASPALAQKIGPMSHWEQGCTPVLVGIPSQNSAQSLIAVGRSLQRGAIQSVIEGVNGDSFVLPPTMLEAIALSSKDASLAIQTIAKFFGDDPLEPIGFCRIGKVLKPTCNPVPICVPLISVG